MFCPKCNKPLFDDDKCHFCGWTKQQPVVAAPEPQETSKNTLPKSYDIDSLFYYIDSWLLFAVVFIVGLVRLYAYYSSGSELIYKGIINCFAAFVFIPQIKAGTNNIIAIFAIKILAAAAIILFI